MTAGRFVSLFVLGILHVWAQGPLEDPLDDATDRIIVQFKSSVPDLHTAELETAVADLDQHLPGGTGLQMVRHSSAGLVMKVPGGGLPPLELEELVANMTNDPRVATVEVDTKVHAQLLPNDALYPLQWNLHATSRHNQGMDMPSAWPMAPGLGSGVVVAVIDSGIAPHVDLSANTLPGYDMIDDVHSANDGDGRDADATDPGNRLAPNTSTWHGTMMAGIIAAITNNQKGIAGIASNARLLPVRTQGVGGGYTSNLIDSLRWASGMSVAGTPPNPTPAQVMNVALGGRGACHGFLQSAIDDVVARGAVVVVAAGNSNRNTSLFKPCNCANVICVGGHSRNGTRGSYSNFGAAVDVMAPGGDRSTGGVISTSNAGRNGPGEHCCCCDSTLLLRPDRVQYVGGMPQGAWSSCGAGGLGWPH